MEARIANNNLPTEQTIEDEANSHTGLAKHFRIAKCEQKRFAMFGIMFGIIGFIYSFMRILKDNYVMSRQEPNCILYIKIFYIMPLSFAIIILINYMLGKRSVSKLFSIFCFGFMALFFILGSLVILEDHIMFKINPLDYQFVSNLVDRKEFGFLKYLLLTISEPLATWVYIVAELWGSLILSYLFLSFLNETCTEKQHGRFIPPLFIIANVSLFTSALVTTLFFKIKDHLTPEQNTLFMGLIFFIQGFLVIGILYSKYILESRIITKPIFISSNPKKIKKKSSIGFKEGIKIMLKSKFLLAMCTAVCFYSVTYNILETVYKNGIKSGANELGVEPGKYSGKFNNIDQYITSITVIILNMSSFSNFVDTKGWILVAMITPLISVISTLCIIGLGTYNSSAESSSIPLTNSLFGGKKSFIFLENLLGTLCLAALKIFKYTAFDVTKEKISMRIEDRYRPKFKSIFDGIFNKFGKSMGALYGIGLGAIISDIDIRGLSPVTAIFVSIFNACWIYAILYLGKSYNVSLKAKEPVDIDLTEPVDDK